MCGSSNKNKLTCALSAGDKFPEPDEVLTGTSLADSISRSGQSQVSTVPTATDDEVNVKRSKSSSKVSYDTVKVMLNS